MSGAVAFAAISFRLVCYRQWGLYTKAIEREVQGESLSATGRCIAMHRHIQLVGFGIREMSLSD